jgi:uncharacterized membrane protein YhaH (DUF805 family)
VRAFLLFLLLLLLLPALSLLVHWWQDGQTPQAWWQWALVLALPLLLWWYFRHFSILACRKGCRPPER